MSIQVSVPPVGLVILNVWATGAVPPAVAEKFRLTGLRSMLGVEVVPLDVEVDVELLDVVVAVPSDTTNVTGTTLD